MTWEGYNYEDAMLINENLVKEDVFTSIHIEEYEAEARDTKLGPEAVSYTHLDVYKRQPLPLPPRIPARLSLPSPTGLTAMKR